MEIDKEIKAISEIISAIEGLDIQERERVFRYALERFGLPVTPSNAGLVALPNMNLDTSTPFQSPIATTSLLGDSTRIIDIRALKEEKSPTSAIQMATLVAYYLQDIAPITERKEAIGASDVEKYFKQANFRLPAGKKGALDTLKNARKAGYFESAGSGEYKLNPVGYNLIAHGLTGATPRSARKKPTKKNRPAKLNKKR